MSARDRMRALTGLEALVEAAGEATAAEAADRSVRNGRSHGIDRRSNGHA
jgi:hypothetical protein